MEGGTQIAPCEPAACRAIVLASVPLNGIVTAVTYFGARDDDYRWGLAWSLASAEMLLQWLHPEMER